MAPTSFAQTTTALGHIVAGLISESFRQTRHCLLQSLQVLIASLAFVDRGGLLLLAHHVAHVLPHGVAPRAKIRRLLRDLAFLDLLFRPGGLSPFLVVSIQ